MSLGTSPAGQSTRASASALVILTLVGSAIIGLLPGTLPLAGTLMVCALGLAALSFVLLRRTLRASRPAVGGVEPTGPGPGTVEEGGPEYPDLRGPRILFYLGTITIMQAELRPALGLTLSEMFFMAAFAGCAFAVLRGHGVVRVPAPLVVGVCIFAFGGAISSLGAHSPAASGTEVLQALYVMLLWVWTGGMVLRSRRQILVALTLWSISAAVNGLGAITQVFGIEALAGPLEGTRATGFTEHPNDLGGGAAVALVPALLLATRAASVRKAATYALRWVVVTLVAVAIVLSASVAAMLAALAATVVWLSVPSVRAPGRVAVVTVLAAALLVAAVAGEHITSPTERLEQVTSATGTQPEAGSGEVRIEIVEAAWSKIKESPIVGTGLDSAGTVVTIFTGGQPRSNTVHGAPLAVWYEAGILGLIGLLVIFGALATAGWRGLAAAGRDDDLLIGGALFAAFAAWVVFALSGPFYFQQYGWFSGVMLLAWALRRDLLAQGFTTPADDRRAVPAVLLRPHPR